MFRDDNGKTSFSRILACLAFVLVLLHIVFNTLKGITVDWNGIAAFLTAAVIPYLGNSVKNGLRFFGKGKAG